MLFQCLLLFAHAQIIAVAFFKVNCCGLRKTRGPRGLCAEKNDDELALLVVDPLI